MICMGGDGLIGKHTSFFLGQGGERNGTEKFGKVNKPAEVWLNQI